jgi:hypothetical protein
MVSVARSRAHPTPCRPPSLAQEGAHTKGCNCKNSKCVRKYCECYRAGVPSAESSEGSLAHHIPNLITNFLLVSISRPFDPTQTSTSPPPVCVCVPAHSCGGIRGHSDWCHRWRYGIPAGYSFCLCVRALTGPPCQSAPARLVFYAQVSYCYPAVAPVGPLSENRAATGCKVGPAKLLAADTASFFTTAARGIFLTCE